MITIPYFRWCQRPSFFIEASRTCFFLILIGIYYFYRLFILTLVSLEVSFSFNICSILLSLSRSPDSEPVRHKQQSLLFQRRSLGGGDAPHRVFFPGTLSDFKFSVEKEAKYTGTTFATGIRRRVSSFRAAVRSPEVSTAGFLVADLASIAGSFKVIVYFRQVIVK